MSTRRQPKNNRSGSLEPNGRYRAEVLMVTLRKPHGYQGMPTWGKNVRTHTAQFLASRAAGRTSTDEMLPPCWASERNLPYGIAFGTLTEAYGTARFFAPSHYWLGALGNGSQITRWARLVTRAYLQNRETQSQNLRNGPLEPNGCYRPELLTVPLRKRYGYQGMPTWGKE